MGIKKSNSTSMPARKSDRPLRRAVIIGGVRTPFLRSFGAFTKLDTIALGTAAVKGLLRRYPVEQREIDGLTWGGVILPSAYSNIGREIVLELGIPPEVEGSTVSRVCTSGLFAITTAAAAIERGDAEIMIAGGGDSTSNAELKMPQALVQKLAPVAMNRKSTPLDYMKAFMQLNMPGDLLPRKPSVRERSTGELMGEAAEKMGQRNGISREAQDSFAAQSHQRAAAAMASGRFADELTAIEAPGGKRISADDIVRGDTSVEKLAKLRPAFDKEGSLTAGNSSTLTDGAAAVLLMSEERARALGHDKLVAFRSWSYDAVDPADQMLLGPAISMPRAAARAGMSLDDIDLIDIHEAFSAQVLTLLKMLGSEGFARQRLGMSRALGDISPEEVNIHGGSIALGHPFAATGARMVTTMSNELKLSGKGAALLGICGGGGVAAGAVLEQI